MSTSTASKNPRFFFLLVLRHEELDLRRREDGPGWRSTCPRNPAHTITISYNGTGAAVCCHGASDAGHSLSRHRHVRDGEVDVDDADCRERDLADTPWPCAWCGCAESEVLAALGARGRDKYPQTNQQARCARCDAFGYDIPGLGPLCLEHIVDAVGLDRAVLFGRAA